MPKYKQVTDNRISKQKQEGSGAIYPADYSVELTKLSLALQNMIVTDVNHKTADYTLLSTEVTGNKVFTNQGATGKVTFTLPTAVKDQRITFICLEDEQMQIDAGSGDKILLQNDVELESIINTNTGKILVLWCVDDEKWVGLNADSWTNAAGRAVWAGGQKTGPAYSNTIDYVEIPTLGNATDFGDLTVARAGEYGCSSSTRGLFGGGSTGTTSNVIDYITIAITGNATDFGDLTVARSGLGACSSSTRGVFGGGFTSSVVNTIDYVTIGTPGNATDFGDLTQSRQQISSCSSPTRGIFAGGDPNSATRYNTIDYITIATPGNATDFGDLSVARTHMGALASSTRGVFAGGVDTPGNIIDYVTIASTGNATDFGDLSTRRRGARGCNNPTRGLFGGGYYSVFIDVIDYITINTTGNATDFGDLSEERQSSGSVSNAHGGL